MPNHSIQVDVNTSLHQLLEGYIRLFGYIHEQGVRLCHRPIKSMQTDKQYIEIDKTELTNQFKKQMLL